MKKKLAFVCAWSLDKKRQWSGTCYALFNSLSRYYNVIEINSGIYNRHSIMDWVLNQLLSLSAKFHIFSGYKEWFRQKCVESRVVREVDKSDCDIIFQFEECPCRVVNKKQYIFQDLSVDYLRRIYKDNAELHYAAHIITTSSKLYDKRAERQLRFYQNAAGIFTMSHWLRDDLIEKSGIPAFKVLAVGGGINIDVTGIDDSKKQRNKFLFVGRDFQRKNGPLVIEAFKLLLNRRPDVELYIAGPNEATITDKNVYFLGDLSTDQLKSYFNRCDVFVMPSKFEAYGLAFAEALTFGLPCIARNAFEMPYFIEEGKSGYLLKNEQPEELADLMLSVLENEEMFSYVRGKRSWYMNEYSWDSVAKRICNFIDK